MKNLEEKIENHFFEKVIAGIRMIKTSVAGRVAVYSLLGALSIGGIGYSCADAENNNGSSSAESSQCNSGQFYVDNECVAQEAGIDSLSEPIKDTCKNECDIKGEKKSIGKDGIFEKKPSGWKECGNFDDDSCLEWSPLNSCAENEYPHNGACSDICYTNIFTFQDFCDGNRLFYCEPTKVIISNYEVLGSGRIKIMECGKDFPFCGYVSWLDKEICFGTGDIGDSCQEWKTLMGGEGKPVLAGECNYNIVDLCVREYSQKIDPNTGEYDSVFYCTTKCTTDADCPPKFSCTPPIPHKYCRKSIL